MIPVTTTSARRTLVIAFTTALAAAVATGACGPDEPEFHGPIDGDTYVAVMGELADLDRFPPSGRGEATRAERADSARLAILDRHGVTADELLEFAETAGAHPGLMVEFSERIVTLSDSLAQQRTGAGRAADSVAAVADSAAAPAADSVAAVADSLPPEDLDPRPLSERARELREPADTESDPSP